MPDVRDQAPDFTLFRGKGETVTLSELRAIANINAMYIRTRDGTEVPFSTVATYRVETGYQSIERLDRLRTLEVSADVSEEGAAPRTVPCDHCPLARVYKEVP